MGHARARPKHLAKKLLQIRKALGLSQSELVQELGVDIHYSNISKYELDKNEPPLDVLLAYARCANVLLADIVDDEIELGL
ncbi:MAG TPA: helix-turn-helix transcriptional regulator [Pyrinomonadaceae bacterium]|nr:helix-turn-helix transcriptional regulator [Pyrinomonadaceae bacterium]